MPFGRHVHDRCAEQFKARGRRFLTERNHGDPMLGCKPFNEPQQRRNHSLSSPSINAAGGDLTGALAERHGVTPPDTYRVLLAEQRTEVAAG
jgi:hypothetical protein